MDKRVERIYREKLEKMRSVFLEMGADKLKELGKSGEIRLIEKEVLAEERLTLPEAKEMIGLIYAGTRSKIGILSMLADDEKINEIMVNGPDKIFIETGEGSKKSSLKFSSREELEEVIRNIAASVHREINEMNPILDARLENGSRVNAVFRNIVQDGPVLTIRKFAKKRITMEDMINRGTLTRECADVLRLLVKSGYNIVISGGTSSGKTTFLNALTDSIPSDERVVVIEDSRELMLDNIDNIVQMECHTANSQGNGAVTMDMLIRTSLRMRPDRIIVGEVRGAEVAMMLQAMNTGHDGSITTGHGNSVAGMLKRLEAMYLMAGDIPLEAVRDQILEGVDIFVHLNRSPDGTRKVAEVSELVGMAGDFGEYVINPLFKRENDGELEATGFELVGKGKLIASKNARI